MRIHPVVNVSQIVEEVLKRLEENDLFVKPEKYVWKVREVDFLGVIIGKGEKQFL